MRRLDFIGSSFAFQIVMITAIAITAKGQGTEGAAVAGIDAAKQLTIDIRQRDSAERRAKALQEIRAMLDADAASQATALTVLARTADIKLDRDGLEPKVASLLVSRSAEVRRAALTALPTLNPGPERIAEAAKLAKDPDSRVRASVMASIMWMRRAARIDRPVNEPALSLLGDDVHEVVVETARSLWSVPISPEVERRVIELSRFEDGNVPGHKSLQYWMNYFVLSTRPHVSKPVAERLAEIARHPELDHNWTGRAIWGLARACSPDAADVVARALVEELDHSLLPYNREWAVRGLIGVQTEAARKKLAQVAAGDESEEIRRMAANAISRRPP